MVLLLSNIVVVVLWVMLIRWKTESDKSRFRIPLFFVSLMIIGADVSIPYKEIRREPAKMLQLEWDSAKYEGYGPKVLRKVDSFSPAPHTRPVYANFFGFEIENNAIEK